MNTLKRLVSGVASHVLPHPLDKAANFYAKNKSLLDGYTAEGKRILAIVKNECRDPHALRNTIKDLKDSTIDWALRELDVRSVTTATTASKNDLIQKVEKAIEAHAQKEPTKVALRAFAAKVSSHLDEFRAAVSITPSEPTSSFTWGIIGVPIVRKGIDSFFQKTDTEIFNSKPKS
ncbi:MAG: hypothetical protein LBS22_02925 [Puniceicoccales bacterium]|jgi:hypothetical protein|nr:hypothetical protein [Puniceicoccales bacterium]